jgi:hypothetical protein
MLFNSGKRILGLRAILIVAGVWLAIDLSGFGLHSSDLRQFDPDAVARLETDMWRSYYDHRQILLFFQLAKTLRDSVPRPFSTFECNCFPWGEGGVHLQRRKEPDRL